MVHMIRFIRMAGVVLLASGLARCDGESAQPRITPVAPVALRYQIEGMHCDGCVQAITEKVTKIDGVVDCRVSLETRQANVAVREASSAAAVQQAIERLGYKVTPAMPAVTAP